MSRWFPALVALAAASWPMQIQSQRGIPVVQAVACKVEFKGAVLDAARWGGRIVTYDISTGTDGEVTGLKRRVIGGIEHLAALVNLQSFESCIRQWRFEGRGDY